MTDLIDIYVLPENVSFLSVSNGPTSILSDIVITLGKSHETIFVGFLKKSHKYLWEMFLRRLRDVMEKTSVLWYTRDVLKTSQKRHLFWDVFETS